MQTAEQNLLLELVSILGSGAKVGEMLQPYSKKYYPEIEARALIGQTGARTFPRPKGIPENYLVRVTDKGAGMEYVHPLKTDSRVRLMPGKPHSEFPYQQKPYVIHMKDGTYRNKFGYIVEGASPEAHIPMDEFVFILN